jgi:DNA-directed RNA polymerase specialized sigma24 family protein
VQREGFWRELLLRFDRRLRAYLRRARWNECEIEELVWDTWALAVEREETLTASSDPWPALRALAAGASARRLRMRRHELLGATGVLNAAQTGDTVESGDDERALARWTERVLAQLPTQQRVAVDFRYRWRWPYWVVAVAIETTESTARVHAWRGLDKLRRIAADCPPPVGQ